LPCLKGQFEVLLCLQTNMMASNAMMLAMISVGYSIGSSRSRISIGYVHQDAAEGNEALAKEIVGTREGVNSYEGKGKAGFKTRILEPSFGTRLQEVVAGVGFEPATCGL